VRKLTFTFYHTARTNEGKPYLETWERWCNRTLLYHTLKGSPEDVHASDTCLNQQKDGSCLVLGHIPEGETRAKGHVEYADALALDLDGQTAEEIIDVLERLDPFEYVLYSTHKHGSDAAGGKWKIRIVAPLAEPVGRDDFPVVWEEWTAFTGGYNDPSTKDISHLYYLPTTFDLRLAIAERHEGRWLNAKTDLPSIKQSDSPGSFTAASSIIEVRRALERPSGVTADLRPAFKALAAGESFARRPQRHVVMRSLTLWIAERFTLLTRETIEDLFVPSLKKMASEDPDPLTLDAIWTAYEGGVVKARKWRQEIERRMQTEKTGIDPYTTEDLERIATKQGWKPEELKRRWVVQRDGFAWFLDDRGEYQGPFGREDHLMACRKYLTPTEARLIEVGPRSVKPRSTAAIIAEVGTLAKKIVCDLSASFTTFSPSTGTLFEAVSPIRSDLTSTFHDDVDRWLRVLGGEHYDRLLDWLSVLPDLDQMLCAIYFDGPKGVGKSMFARGAAALWSETATPGDIELFLGSFNDTAAMCPLIFADEDMPKSQTRDVTAKLREEIAKTSRVLKRKYKNPSEMRGAIRLTLAANNELLIAMRKAMTVNDLEAFAERFLYIHIPDQMKDFFADPSWSKEAIQHMITRGIAEHSLWLQANHQIKNPGKRFAVGGNVDKMHRLLLTSGHWNGLVCEWLVKYLMDPQAYNVASNNAGLVRCLTRDHWLAVNPQGVSDCWDTYIKGLAKPSTPEIATAIRSISKVIKAKDGSDKARIQRRWHGRHYRYSVVDLDVLLDWSRKNNVGDPTTMLFALGLEPTDEQLHREEVDVEDEGAVPDNVSPLQRRRSPAGVKEDGTIEYPETEEEY